MLVVMGIIAILMVLVAPAFTSLKSAGDVTNAAYTIKGVLDTARTYAKANNTYVWVGFYEEDVSVPSPAPAGIGRVVMSVVASKDGTMIYNPSSPLQITTTQLIQVGKLTKIENVHLAGDALFTATPSTPTGSTFDYRPRVTYRIASPPNASPPDSTTPFNYPVGNPAPAGQYTFFKVVQFSPGGEARIDNSTVDVNGTAIYPLQVAAEIGLRATHGTTVDTISPNVVAIQFGGLGANVRIYRK
jgi:type II secretory pathway pseudopilin PulG